MNKLIFALIATVTAMGAAHAEGAYVGLGVATSDHSFKIGSNVKAEGYKPSVKVFGGVDLTPMFGIEAGYTDLRKADHTYTIGNINGRTTTEGQRAYLAGKATLPLNDAFSVYGKLGAGYSKVEFSNAIAGRDDSKTELYGALGGQYNLSKQVALTLEYERYGKTKDFGAKADAISVGARYNF
ncbi:MAG: porin family protein [Pseudomonadota bacterium]